LIPNGRLGDASGPGTPDQTGCGYTGGCRNIFIGHVRAQGRTFGVEQRWGAVTITVSVTLSGFIDKSTVVSWLTASTTFFRSTREIPRLRLQRICRRTEACQNIQPFLITMRDDTNASRIIRNRYRGALHDRPD